MCTRRSFLASSIAAFSAGNTTAFDALRFDVRSGATAGSTSWPPAILPGSLVKPFTALAYGASHGDKFPTLRCNGCRDGIAPHGDVDLVRGIALSCNRYFEEISLRVPHRQMLLTAAEYGLTAPPDSVEARYGMGREWRVAPLELIRAYLQIRHAAIREGLRLCASQGTAKAVGAGVAAKTGTAPCEHVKRMPGDGLAIALWPAEEPRVVALVREHGVPGAVAARRLRGVLGAS